MNEVIFEGNIMAYMQNPAGPIALDITRRAEAVVEEARHGGPVEGVAGIMAQYSGVQDLVDDVGYELVEGPMGIEAYVGIRSRRSGRLAEYLRNKEKKEHIWLLPALEKARLSERFGPSGV